MSKFAIIAAPRTGSNLLCTLLDSHPEILCHHEVFNPSGIFTALTQRHRTMELGSIASRDRDPLGFLERVWTSGRDHRAVGFKWTRGQNEVVLRSVLGDVSVKKIVLRRSNRVKTFVSDKIAQRTGQWEVYDAAELIRPRPHIEVDRHELLRHIELNAEFYERIQQTLDESSQPYIDLVYEMLFDKAEQRRLLEFLEVEDTKYTLVAASVKQNPTDLKDVVANFGELAASVNDRKLAAELYDRGL
jgi:LPS sulfotransferase NodH